VWKLFCESANTDVAKSHILSFILYRCYAFACFIQLLSKKEINTPAWLHATTATEVDPHRILNTRFLQTIRMLIREVMGLDALEEVFTGKRAPESSTTERSKGFLRKFNSCTQVPPNIIYLREKRKWAQYSPLRYPWRYSDFLRQLCPCSQPNIHALQVLLRVATYSGCTWISTEFTRTFSIPKYWTQYTAVWKLLPWAKQFPSET
jgi:hypothetical protein